MMKSVRILLIDDDTMHLKMMNDRLKKIDYHHVAPKNTVQQAAEFLDSETPDIILIDHFLDNGHTSVDFIKQHLVKKEIPIIVFTSFYNEDVFEEILYGFPMYFISKNCSNFDLKICIQLANVFRVLDTKKMKLKDFFFVKVGKNIKRIIVDDIQMIEVDGKYLNVYINERTFIVRSTLNDFAKRLPDNFIKVHQSYIVNFNHLETINIEENKIQLRNCEAHFSRNFKKSIFNTYLIT